MFNFFRTFGSARVRTNGLLGPPDPATMGFAIYNEQRVDTNDYSAADGTWEDRSGNNRHWVQANNTLRPPTGASVNGALPPQWISSNADLLTNTSTLDNFGDATEIAFSIMIYVDASIGTWSSPSATPAIFGDTSGWFRFIAGNDAGLIRIGCSAYTSTYITVHHAIEANRWYEVNVRLSSGRLTIAVDGPPIHAIGADTDRSKACGAIGAVNVATRLGGVGTTYWSGKIISFIASTNITDENYTKISNWRKYLFPSANLGAAPPDISTFNFTQYHEQGRSAATNYDPSNIETSDSDPWVGLPSAGTSLGKDLVAFGSGSWILPTIGTTIDGTNMIRCGTDLCDLKSQSTALDFISLSEFTIFAFVKIDPSAQLLSGGTTISYLNRIRLFAGRVGDVSQCRMQIISSIDNYVDSPTFPTNTWVAVFARFSGGIMDIRINKTNGTPVAGIANVNPAIATDVPRIAHQTQGVTIHDRLSAGMSKVRLSDAECDAIYDWWMYRFPSTDKSKNLVARSAKLFLVGDDVAGSVGATDTTWISRTSAGNSGDGRKFSTALYNAYTGYGPNPSTPFKVIDVNGHKWLETDITLGSPMALVNGAGSVAYSSASTEMGGPGAFSITIACMFYTAGMTRTNGSGGPYILGTSNYYSTPTGIGASSNGMLLAGMLNQPSSDYQLISTAAGTIVNAIPCIIQAQFNPVDGTWRIRKNNDAWVSFAGTATRYQSAADVMCLMGNNAASPTFKGAIGAFYYQSEFSTDMNEVRNMIANMLNITL